jgi:hypothetical protein
LNLRKEPVPYGARFERKFWEKQQKQEELSDKDLSKKLYA